MSALRVTHLLAMVLAVASNITAQTPPPPLPAHVPALPDPSGWGVHVLAMARAPDGTLWVGTHGDGIYALRPGATLWTNMRADTSGSSIIWNSVHAFAFRRDEVWYGTVGHGWGVSYDAGRTWRNWGPRELASRGRYVTPNGIVLRGDTVVVATTDGLHLTTDGGRSWGVVTDSTPGGLPSNYVLTIEGGRGAGIYVATLRGLGSWRSGIGWRPVTPPPSAVVGGRVRAIFPVLLPGAVVPLVLGGETCAASLRPARRGQAARWQCMSIFERDLEGAASIRSLVGCEGVLCAGATSRGALYGARMGLTMQPRTGTPRSRDAYASLPPPDGQPGDTLFGTACGLLGRQPASCTADGDTAGVRVPAQPVRGWLGRPVARTDQPYADQTYRFGSTDGGTRPPQRGLDFNNPMGTPVLAAASGTVVFSGPSENGALTVVVRHDTALVVGARRLHGFTVYSQNSRNLVSTGQRVQRGQPVARVGSTGGAPGSQLRFEVHASPVDSVAAVVDPRGAQRFARNPELWLEPLPGTGVVIGQVWDAQGRPVRRARVYGLVKPQPQETPFSFTETYGDGAWEDPLYGEHFAVGDVPPGQYVLGVEIDGRRVFRRVRVEAGRVTLVEFRP